MTETNSQQNDGLEPDIIDPLAPPDLDALPSVKERMVEALGKNIRVDLFLYSVKESYETLRAMDKLPESGHAPLLAETKGELSEVLGKLIDWYKREYEFMASGKPMDYIRLGEVSEPVAYFFHDLLTLMGRLGMDIPKWTDDPSHTEFWKPISHALRAGFGDCSKWYEQFLQWTYRDDTEEPVEPGSRPPIGRYAPRYSRDRGDRNDRGGDRGGSRDRGGRSGDRGGSRDRGGRSKPGQGRGERGESGDRPERGDRGRDRGRGERGGNRDRGRGERSGNRDQGEGREQRSAKLEEAALIEVSKAIRTLKSDGNLTGVTLQPANSFYRRMQHQQAADQGFNSESVGEGPDRAVRVTRKD